MSKLQILPTFVDALGIKENFEGDLKSLFENMDAYNHKMNVHKAFTDIRMENYFKKHPYLLK